MLSWQFRVGACMFAIENVNLLKQFFWPFASFLIAAITYGILNIHGFDLDPDGAAYWQGAVSL
jgi:hypothetical protein